MRRSQGRELTRREERRQLYQFLQRFARPHLGIFVITAALGLAVGALTTLQPLVLAPLIDAATGRSEPAATSWRAVTLNNVGPTLLAWTGLQSAARHTFLVVALAFVAVVAVTGVVAFANMLLVARVRTALFLDLQESLYRHVLGLSMSYFVRERTGALGSRLANDAFRAADIVEPVVRNFVQGGAQLALVSVLLLRTDAWLTVGVLLVLLGHLIITRALRGGIRRLIVDEFNLLAEQANRVHEAVLGMRVVKAFGAERFELSRFVEGARRLGRVMKKGARYRNAEAPLRDLADAIGLALVVLMAFAALSDGRLSVSGLVLFVVLVRRALRPIGQIASALLRLQSLAGAASALLAILREAPAVVDGSRQPDALGHGIRLDEVSFAYEPGVDVLRGISLEIKRGEMVALVGPSGGGKSTLVDLIARFSDPTRGRVLWDGTDVREFRQSSYRRRFGIVSQEALLWHATAAENIAYGRGLDRELVAWAARVAHAASFVDGLSHGYDTVLGDRGMLLSGGQRQRIAIARALYGRPDVLILDEATSALDGESEAHIQTALEEISKNMTLIVIAHRLSTIVRADRILLIEDGRIAAAGTHEDLLQQNALYRRIYETQLLARG